MAEPRIYFWMPTLEESRLVAALLRHRVRRARLAAPADRIEQACRAAGIPFEIEGTVIFRSGETGSTALLGHAPDRLPSLRDEARRLGVSFIEI